MLAVRAPNQTVRSWKDFFVQIATIAVGLLIALGAESGAEWLHWRHQGQIGERALKADFSRFVQQRGEQVAATQCIAARLAELRAIVEAGAQNGRLGEIGPIPLPPPQPWEITSWDTMVASQAATHLQQEQMLRYAEVAHWAKDAHEAGVTESETWAILASLSGPPRRFSDAEQARLRADIARAAHFSWLIRVITKTTEGVIAETGLLTADELEAERTEGAHSEGLARICTPIAYKPVAD